MRLLYFIVCDFTVCVRVSYEKLRDREGVGYAVEKQVRDTIVETDANIRRTVT